MWLLAWYEEHIVFLLVVWVFALFISACLIDWRWALKKLSAIKWQTWALLCIFIFAGGMLRGMVFPSFHQMYIDEPMYIEKAKNILERGEAVNCRLEGSGTICWMSAKKGVMWPFILAISFLFFGKSASAAFLTVKAIAMLSIAAAFFLGYALFLNHRAGLWCSLFLAVSPLHILWSNTVETAVPSLFFVMISVLMFVLHLHKRDIAFGALSFIFFLGSILLRYENAILLPAALIVYLLTSKLLSQRIKRGIILYSPSILLLASAGVLLVFIFFLEIYWASLGHHAAYLYAYHVGHFLKDVSVSGILALPAAVGFFTVRKSPMWMYVICLPLLMFSAISIPLSYESRMEVLPAFFFSLLAACGMEGICTNLCSKKKPHHTLKRYMIVAAYLAFAVFSLLPSQVHGLYKSYASLNHLETLSAVSLEKDVPKSCIVIAYYPAVVHGATSHKSVETVKVIADRSFIDDAILDGECVYFFSDHYCHRNIDKTVFNCNSFLSRYPVQLEKEYSLGEATYSLYRVTGVGGSLDG
jgi:hypothetical protein